MGAGLVGAALAPPWPSLLTSTEQLILVAMSLTARDTSSSDTDAGMWWAGIETLMVALDGDVPERGTREWNAAERRIGRALNRLQSVGAITRQHSATARRRAVWQITTNAPRLNASTATATTSPTETN